MLAGRMKLNNFLLLAAGLLVAVVGAAFFFFSSAEPSRPLPVAAVAVPSQPAPGQPPPGQPPPSSPPPSPALAASDQVRAVDRVVLGFLGKDLKSDKWKDATKGQPYKVNLYQDPGEASTNRAKIDLDRDDKWDEKWTFKGQEVLREVAPNDDEKYSESYSWTGSAWAKR